METFGSKELFIVKISFWGFIYRMALLWNLSTLNISHGAVLFGKFKKILPFSNPQ